MTDAERIERLQNLLGNKDSRIRDLDQRIDDAKQRADDAIVALRWDRDRERKRADDAEQRVKEFEAANQGWQMIEDERVAFVATAEERVAALTPFVDEIAARSCECETWWDAGHKCDPCRARALAEPAFAEQRAQGTITLDELAEKLEAEKASED